VTACPRCGKPLEVDVAVCRRCLHIVDREKWQHDAGRLGADDRGGGRPLEDPPLGPLPVTGSGLAFGALGSAARLIPVSFLAKWSRRARRAR
jgi:hypothetical protein